MSTTCQLAAYREIKHKQLQEAQIKAYGMVPISARHPGKCGCKKVWPAGTGYRQGECACEFDRDTKIVKFRGAWWTVSCVERVTQQEFRDTALFTLEESWTRKDGSVRWAAKAWTNNPEEVDQWKRNLLDDERVVERGKQTA